MNDNNVISIVIPIFNVEKYIENCIRSVGMQDSLAYEVILVDDGSQDSSMEIALRSVKKYIPSQINCKVIRQENAGLAIARNRGLENATTKWIMFLDADDMLQKRAVSTVLHAIENYESNMYISDFVKVYKSDEFTETNKAGTFEIVSSNQLQDLFLKRKKKILAPGTVYNREWLESLNLHFEKLPFSEDQHFIWRVLLVIDEIVIIHDQLYNYLIRQNSIMTSSNGDKIILGYQKIEELNEQIQKSNRAIDDVKKFMLSRWVLGALRSSCGMLNWRDYKKVAVKMNYKSNCAKLARFPDKAVNLLAIIAMTNLRVFYTSIRLMGKAK